MLKDLPTPDPKKVSPYHDNYFDVLFDEAVDKLERDSRSEPKGGDEP